MPDDPKDFLPEPLYTCEKCEREGLSPFDMAIWRMTILPDGEKVRYVCTECAYRKEEDNEFKKGD